MWGWWLGWARKVTRVCQSDAEEEVVGERGVLASAICLSVLCPQLKACPGSMLGSRLSAILPFLVSQDFSTAPVQNILRSLMPEL